MRNPYNPTITPDVVSIHASRCWEAMQDDKPDLLNDQTVSIHASRCWEAMPRAGDNYWARYEGFNPRLPLLGGDA